MRYTHMIILTAVSLLLSSCGANMKHTWTKAGYTGKKFDKVLVIGATRNLDARSSFETTTVDLLRENNINAHVSFYELPPFENVNEISEDKIIQVVEAGNYDAVLVASLVDINRKEVGGADITPYAPLYPGTYFYGLGYAGFAYNSYYAAYEPDYYRDQNVYAVETRLYDATVNSREEALVWSGQSNITNPTTFEKGAAKYANVLVKSLLGSKMMQ